MRCLVRGENIGTRKECVFESHHRLLLVDTGAPYYCCGYFLSIALVFYADAIRLRNVRRDFFEGVLDGHGGNVDAAFDYDLARAAFEIKVSYAFDIPKQT